MATYVPPKRATAYILYTGLVSQADTKLLQSNPTIAAGDFKVSIDGGALNNLTTLPTVTPAASKMVKISLSIAEMTGDNITVVCSDAAGAEWCDQIINLQTSAAQVDELVRATTPANTLDVDASGDVNVAAIAAGAITAAAIAADAITSSEFAQSAADKVWSSAARTLTSVMGVKKNTALANFEFEMIDATTHITPKAGLAVTSEVSIDGGAFGATTNNASEVSDGIYKINLAAADLNGDFITLKFTAAGADQRTFGIKTSA